MLPEIDIIINIINYALTDAYICRESKVKSF